MGSIAQKQILLVVSIFISAFCAFQIIHSLSFLKDTVVPEVYLSRITIALVGFFLPILGGWYAFRFIGGGIFSLFAAVIVIFAELVSSSPVFIWFLLEYGALCFLLYRMDQYFENQVANSGVDLEKYQSEKNDLEVSYRVKGEGISALFEKYSTYYNLRRLAEELATTLLLRRLSEIVVDKAVEFISKGDIASLALAYSDEGALEVVAKKAVMGDSSASSAEVAKYKKEDLFDLWVIKNRRRLIVTDAHQDFRFDLRETSRQETIRSLIIAPIFHHGHVIGTLRLHSGKRETFTNDDLRLLDTISVLASSALSNAMLFEQTEQLAIKDSLTGLYVRRYFFDRLKDEHRRALLTKRSLSMLMCDVDHFKECNDKYGHSVGDLILVHFTKILNEVCENGIVGRYGGEEFAILLPETSKDKAIEVAEAVRSAIEKSPYVLRRENIDLTVSVGVASVPDDALDRGDLVKKADEALYEAKKSGRNRVCSSNG